MGDRRWETGDGRQETADRRQENGFSDVISEKFSAFNLAGEFINFLRTRIHNQKYKIAVATKSAKWGQFFCSLLLHDKFSGLRGS